MRTLNVMAVVSLIAVLASCHSTPKERLVGIVRTMIVTAYCDCKECCGWERTWYGKPVNSGGSRKGEYKKPGRTASGEKARHGTIAADSRYTFGTRMHIPGYGDGVVRDRGGAITGDHIDVFFKRHKDALRWGRQKLTVTIWVPAPQVAKL